MNKNYKLYFISVIISFLVSLIITIFVYSVGNKDNEVIYSFNQKFELDNDTFATEMSSRMQSYIEKYLTDFQNLNLKINHELNLNPSFRLSTEEFQLLLDKSIKIKYHDVFYDLFKEDYLINKFNKFPLKHFNEFKKHYYSKYQADEKVFDFFEKNIVKITSSNDNIDFKNFISNTIILNI